MSLSHDEESSGERKPVQGDLLDASTMIAAQTSAQLDTQIATAKHWPRSLDRFKKAVMDLAVVDERTAGSMFYALPRGNKTVEGPSVRMAEIVATSYGNLRIRSQIVAIDEEFVTAQGSAFDLESNVAMSVEVKRRITNKHGVRFKEDMIQTTCNAACAIAMRQAIFKVVPRAFYQEAYLAARRVSIGDVKTLATRRADMMAYFLKMGVSEDRVCAAVLKPGVEDIGLPELGLLRGLATALRDNETTVENAFPDVRPMPTAVVVDGEVVNGPVTADNLLGVGLPTPPAPPSAEWLAEFTAGIEAATTVDEVSVLTDAILNDPDRSETDKELVLGLSDEAKDRIAPRVEGGGDALFAKGSPDATDV